MNHNLSSQDTQTLLRNRGMKATPQRLAIAELLLTKPTHTTAQQLCEQLKPNFPSISQNTVYLTLASFEASGLLRRFCADGKMIFDSNLTPHHHGLCRKCGVIEDVPEKQKIAHPDELQHWQLEQDTLTWTGLCPNCSTR
jgi:Fur family peroxide stress response transcriptional regulator